EPKPRTCRRYLRQRHAIIAGAAAGLPEAVHLRMPDRTALLHATIMPGSNDRVGFLEHTIDGQPSWCLLVGRAHESASNESMQCILELCYTSCRPGRTQDDNEEQCGENSRGRDRPGSADSVCAHCGANQSASTTCRTKSGIRRRCHLLHCRGRQGHRLSSGRPGTCTLGLPSLATKRRQKS